MTEPTAEGHGKSSSPAEHSLLSLFLPAFILALGVGIAAPALPVYAKSFQISFGVASLVIIVNLAGGMVLMIPIGRLIDRIGPRYVVLAGPVLTALASFLIATAHSFPELLIYRFIEGAAQQMWIIGRLALVSSKGGANRGKQITGMFGMDATGQLVGPAIGGFTAAAWGIKAPFVLYGIITLIAIIPSFFLVRAQDGSGSAREAAPSSKPRERVSMREFLVPAILVVCFAQFLAAITRGGLFAGTLDLYAVYAYGIGARTLGFLGAAGAAISIPLTFMTGHLMDRFGRKATIVPGFCALGATLACMALSALVHWPFAIYVVIFLASRVALGSVSGSMQVLGSDLAPAHARGIFFGLWGLVRQIGAFLSPTVFAIVSQYAGFAAAFLMLSALSVSTALLIATRVKETYTSHHAEPSPVTEAAETVPLAPTGAPEEHALDRPTST